MYASFCSKSKNSNTHCSSGRTNQNSEQAYPHLLNPEGGSVTYAWSRSWKMSLVPAPCLSSSSSPLSKDQGAGCRPPQSPHPSSRISDRGCSDTSVTEVRWILARNTSSYMWDPCTPSRREDEPVQRGSRRRFDLGARALAVASRDDGPASPSQTGGEFFAKIRR